MGLLVEVSHLVDEPTCVGEALWENVNDEVKHGIVATTVKFGSYGSTTSKVIWRDILFIFAWAGTLLIVRNRHSVFFPSSPLVVASEYL